MKAENPSSYIGKHVIIGITVVDHEDNVIEQHQLHGDIVRIENSTLVVLQKSGEEYKLPFDQRAFEPAPAGEYRLRSTGEVVVNPDLMTSWTIHKPPPDYQKPLQ